MPAYNEGEIISEIVDEWSKIAKNCSGVLAVINDGSSDDTSGILKDKFDKHCEFIYIEKQNSGHGLTCMEGYRWAISNDFKWIFQTDSDGQTKSKEFLEIWKQKEDHDFIFGYRINRADGLGRKVISKILQMVNLLIFKIYVKDVNVPFRLMKTRSLNPLLDKIKSELYLANAFLTVIIEKYAKINWVEISFSPRKGGVPSVSWNRFYGLGFRISKEFWQIRNHIK